jgi:hypothetical protein
VLPKQRLADRGGICQAKTPDNVIKLLTIHHAPRDAQLLCWCPGSESEAGDSNATLPTSGALDRASPSVGHALLQGSYRALRAGDLSAEAVSITEASGGVPETEGVIPKSGGPSAINRSPSLR